MTAKKNQGVKWGWTGGFLGGSLWMLLLGIVQLARGELLLGAGLTALYLVSLAVLYLLLPWKRPKTSMGLLYLGTLAPILAGAVFVIWWVFAHDESIWGLFGGFFAIFTPVFFFRGRTWADG